MEPKLIIIRLNETALWSEEIQAKCKAIWGYYLIDISEHIYQCSPTPDVQGYFLYNRFDFIGEPFGEEELSDMERDHGDSPYPFFAVNTKWGKYQAVDCSDFDEGGHEGTWQEFIEGQIENIQCNPIEFEFCNDLTTI